MITEEQKTEIKKIVEETLKVTTQQIGTGILKFELKGEIIHQSFEQLAYYQFHNCLDTYLNEL
jgi:hypothetical protein